MSWPEKFVMKVQADQRSTKTRRLTALVCAGFVLWAAGPAPVLAHHAFAAEFDGDKPINLVGTVTKVRWVNPHSWLYFDVKAADGTLINWGVELASPNALSSHGLSKADLLPGAQIHVKGFLSKSGENFGYAVTIGLADGRVIEAGGAPNTAAAPPGGGA
jgi:hypothetical protein